MAVCIRAVISAFCFLIGRVDCQYLAAEGLRPRDLENNSDDDRQELHKLSGILEIEQSCPGNPTTRLGKTEGNPGILLTYLNVVCGWRFSGSHQRRCVEH